MNTPDPAPLPRRPAPSRRPRRSLQFAIFILHFSIFTSPLPAATPYHPTHPDPVLEPWRWRSFPELKGLGLECLTEDREGNIWFGVNKGTIRYDGTTWTPFTPEDGLVGTPVTALCAARDGSVYAGASTGISRFRDGTWIRVYPPEGDLSWGINNLMEASDGSVWAGTYWGALRLDREGPTLYTTEAFAAALRILTPGLRLSIVPDETAPGRPWSRPFSFLTGEGIGVGVVNGVISALAPGGPGEGAGLKVGDRIAGIDGEAIAASAGWWAAWGQLYGSAGAPVRLTVQREGQPEPFEVTVTREHVEGTFRDFQVYDVFEDREGALWFGLWLGEIVRCDIRRTGTAGAEAWQLYTEADGLDIGRGPHIVQTRDGTIWTVSAESDKGGNRFDGKAWTSFPLSGGSYRTSVIVSKDGTLWVGGRTVYRNGAWTVYPPTDVPLPPTRIVDLLEASDGAFWFAGRGQEAVRLDYGTTRWTTYEGLNFQCETPDGARWFVSRDSSIVAQDGRTWVRYGVEDGLMDYPVSLITTRNGVLWAAGSHEGAVAVARFDGGRWSRQTYIRSSLDDYYGIFYEASDGALWLSTRGTSGVLRFDPSARSGSGGKAWTHYTPPQVHALVYGIGQTADGALWVGGGGALLRFDGETWTPVTEPEELTMRYADTIYSTPTGELWVGTRYYGAFHYDGKTWTQYDVWDGLADNRIMGILKTDEGSVWVATAKGISRFDGRTWTTDALPLPPDAPVIGRGASLLQSRDGALWINLAFDPGRAGTIPLRTIRYEPDTGPPDTKITVSLDEVSQPGNTLLSWKGADPWKSTPDGELRYAWRLDDSAWSPFSTKINDVFLSLPAGDHTFEVKARDRDFNEDPTPAAVQFTVLPPVWQEPWFIGMVALFVGVIGVQATRILASNRRLKQSNTALSSANKDLFGMNRELQRDRAVERIRGEIQAMERAADFETVLSVLAEDLKTAGLSFDTCGIDVLDEPVDDPTPAYFENHGFHYTSYTIEPDGAVNRETYHTPAPFPPVVRETVERFIEGEPWQGRSGQTAIVEVPASGYGRLRLTASDRQDFTEEEIESLQDFASAIALGYARYLDIREIQEQTERKSKFLASMSHELRTPMNAIIGFTRMVLRREKNISERNKENLEKVRMSADHLLELINDILDLSKIESGRMDVNPEPFDIGELISGSCAEVEPLVMAKPELKLTLDLPDGIGEANTDRGRLRQILLNLLSNAIKFTDRGEVAVRASLHGAGREASLVIAVSDTGAGIPPDALESIFEEFQQVKGSDPEHKGTGLGLPITKGFAELMGGSIGVQSEVGEGSTFTVRVPVVYGGG